MTVLGRDDSRTDHGPVIASELEVDGYTINFVTFKQEVDHAPLLRSLPGGQCQCPHWGYVLKGRLSFTFADREGEEVYEAGDAFYLPPGHIQRVEAGTEYVQFSPTEQLKPVSEALMRNMQAMQGA